MDLWFDSHGGLSAAEADAMLGLDLGMGLPPALQAAAAAAALPGAGAAGAGVRSGGSPDEPTTVKHQRLAAAQADSAFGYGSKGAFGLSTIGLTGKEKKGVVRERNRMHARKARLRKKIYVDALKESVEQLEEENERLQGILRKYQEDEASRSGNESKYPRETGFVSRLLMPRKKSTDASAANGAGAGAGEPKRDAVQLCSEDFALLKALNMSHEHFVISDPSKPDNPIVFASDAFYKLTGYSPGEILGRNCRLLQGPLTDRREIAKIRAAVRADPPREVCTVLINYTKAGDPFWNKLFISPIHNSRGEVVNYLAVQKVLDEAIALKLLRYERQLGALQRQAVDNYTAVFGAPAANGPGGAANGASGAGAGSSSSSSSENGERSAKRQKVKAV